MGKYKPGTKVKVVRFGEPDDVPSEVSIVGETGEVLEDRPSQADRFTRVLFLGLHDHRFGEWLFLDREIEAVE